MAYDIGPRIGIQGEKEFNNQIKQINDSIRECGSEMKALSSEFEKNGNSQDALVAKNKNLQKELDLQRQKMGLLQTQYDKQIKRLDELAQAYQKAKTENGEMSAEAGRAETAFNKQASTVSKLSVAMNETQTYINKLNSSIDENADMLEEIEKGARDAATGLSKLSDEADNAGDQLDSIASSTKSEALSGLADNISAIGDAMTETVEESKEYLSIMGQLEASSQRIGYSAEQTNQTYTQLYGILGDNQTAATATANLQALGLSQQDLVQMTELAIGAWAQYGDSIPIDSLAEAINETAQTGIVTGTFADALNWAGISEDAFNEKLASTYSQSERAQMIMEALKSQGLDGVSQGYRDANGALIANNEAQAQYDEAMSRLAEEIMPAVTSATTIAADVLGKLANWFSSLPGPAQKVIGVLGIIILVLGALAPPILTVAAAVTALNVPLLPIIGIIAAVVAAIVAIIAIIQNWGAITEWLGGVWEATKEKLSQVWTEISETASNIWNGIKDTTISVVTSIKDGAVNGFRSLVEGVRSKLSQITSVVSDGFKGAIDFITSLPGKALQWGKDFIGGIADGIKSAIGWIGDAVGSVVDTITSFLHFSRPDKGPLREYEKWMPDFMSGLARGIYDNVDKVQAAARSVSGTISTTMTGNVQAMIDSAAVSRDSTIIVEGDQIVLDGKVIGRTAEKRISAGQVARLKAKGAYA